MSTLEGLLQDATSVYRFTSFIARFCQEQLSSYTYADPTQQFFKYVRDLASCTNTVVEQAVDQARRHPPTIRTNQQKLVAIKDLWRLLHTFVKPAADAHNLRIPVPILELIRTQLRRSGVADPTIVVLLSQQLNYFSHRNTAVRDLAARISNSLAGAPPLPTGLAFIGIPYSQGAGLFTNIILYHELGHFVFEDARKASVLTPEIVKSLAAVFGNDFLSLRPPTQAGYIDQLRTWTEEIYCDLFAIRLIGPAFSFASMELFSLMGRLRPETAVRFSDTHPAIACRFAQHLKILRGDGWWSHFGDEFRSEYKGQIEALAGVSSRDYVFHLDDAQGSPVRVDDRLIQAFLGVLSEVEKVLDSTLPKQPSAIDDFAQFGASVRKLLMHGVVPSAVPELDNRSPEPTTVVNSAFWFYLSSFRDFLSTIRDQDADKITDRVKWIERIEMWTLKALEDVSLARMQKVVSQHGGSFGTTASGSDEAQH